MHHITEDTPPDMLAGAMDLCVRLPDGKDVKISVERSTPMMDLLVQVTTAYKLRPSDHIIQALDMSEKERPLPYKPNTPIGALDTQQIRVLSKGRPPAPRVPPPPGHQPFVNTFRLQVHLPRNQFCVIRVGKHVLLEDIMKKVCEEKNLDPRKYEFRHPANIDKVLDPKKTLNDYEITEITVVQRGINNHIPQAISSSDIMALQREEDRRKQSKTGGGVLNLIFRRGRNSMGSGSISSDTRSISPTQSDDSRSVTPPTVPPILSTINQEPKPVNRPKPPQRKRRPAPKPPVERILEPAHNEKTEQQEVVPKLENGLTICHSRNSSDSSGYHEASILSDHCTTLPRRPKSTIINGNSNNCNINSDQQMELSKSLGNLNKMSSQSKSTMSLSNAGRKKKPPPPPPTLNQANSINNLNTALPVVASCLETPKTYSDISAPASLAMCSDFPKPKPRTTRHPAPVPMPRRNISIDKEINPKQKTPPHSPIKTSTNNTELSPKSKLNRETGFQIGKSMFSLDDSLQKQHENKNENVSVNTVNNSHEENFTNIEIDNIKMFEFKSKQKNKKLTRMHRIPTSAEIYELDRKDMSSFLSLRTIQSEPAALDTKNDTKLWGNVQNLEAKESFNLGSSRWVIGDCNTDSNCSSPVSDVTKQIELNQENVQQSHENSTKVSESLTPVSKIDCKEIPVEKEVKVINSSEVTSQESEKNIAINQKQEEETVLAIEIPKSDPKDEINELETETDWQYTLPSPPTAFRDSSPTNFTDLTNYDTVTLNGLSSDSVVTSPALFEKLESIRDARSEAETVTSEPDNASVKQEEVLTSKYLSLENLEKRKSLVLERELASLKIAQNDTTCKAEVLNNFKSQRENFKNEIEEVIQQRSRSSTLSRNNSQSKEKILLSATDSTLPNFKITTYNQPKSKINIFEDDSIRSNVENKSGNTSKRNSVAENVKTNSEIGETTFLNKRNSLISASTENMYLGKRNSVDNFVFKKPQELPKYSKQTSVTSSGDSVSRSESFSSKNNIWTKSNPVKRSKSHISLDKYKDENKNSSENTEEGLLHKSNSLFNVSGLHSLEVMRMILPKLEKTPPSSPKEVQTPKVEIKKQEEIIPPKVVPKTEEPSNKKYQYRGPPAINLSTWSERPKSQVSLKEDKDYKINNFSTKSKNSNNQLNSNSTELNKNQSNYQSLNIQVNGFEPKDEIDSGKINIKINSEPPKTIIKISNNQSVSNKIMNNFYSRFLNQTTAVGYRKPLGNINGDKPRPHSIAFDSSCPDISRVPIVRAVELKKTVTESQGNKSITQIIPENADNKKLSSVYLSSENVPKPEPKPFSLYTKPITRGNSFASAKSTTFPVTGFREMREINGQYGTLPAKTKPEFNEPPNPFHNVVLRKTATLKRETNTINGNHIPPPPPKMPIVTAVTKKPRQIQMEDPRDLLLESIRNFGGKSGLRSVK